MDILIWKYLHIMCLVYWLGGDLGTFIASRFLINPKWGAEARLVAAKILVACDQGPRFAMPLILPTGLQLAFSLGVLQIPSWAMAVIWLIALTWLAIIMTLHFKNGEVPAWLIKFDWNLRVAMCVVTLSYGFASTLFDTALVADWAGYKLGLYGGTILMGLLVRVKLKPFFSVYGDLMTDRVTDHTNRVIKRAIGGTVPYVKTIWVLLFVISAFGLHILPL